MEEEDLKAVIDKIYQLESIENAIVQVTDIVFAIGETVSSLKQDANLDRDACEARLQLKKISQRRKNTTKSSSEQSLVGEPSEWDRKRTNNQVLAHGQTKLRRLDEETTEEGTNVVVSDGGAGGSPKYTAPETASTADGLSTGQNTYQFSEYRLTVLFGLLRDHSATYHWVGMGGAKARDAAWPLVLSAYNSRITPAAGELQATRDDVDEGFKLLKRRAHTCAVTGIGNDLDREAIILLREQEVEEDELEYPQEAQKNDTNVADKSDDQN